MLQQAKTVRPASVSAWLLASRPKTLTAAAAPVLVGTAVGAHSGQVLVLPAVATLLGALLLQIASNFANDVFDYEKGADTERRLGPTRAVQAGLLSAAQMKRGLWLVLAMALLTGIYLTSVAGFPIVIIGLCSMAAAVAYTGGPYPLGYHGWGDAFVMLFFGFVAVCGTVFVHLGDVPEMALLCSLPLGAVTTNILVVNNLRDRLTDAESGKRTLAVRAGRRAVEIEYVLLYALSYLIPPLLVLLGVAGPWVLVALLTLPLAIRNVVRLRRAEGREFNPLLESSAKLVFLYGFTLALGIVLDAWTR